MLFARLLLALFVLASSASSMVFFVDPVFGDDANSGTSAGEAVRTISRALELAGTDLAIVDIAPGIYDVAHGETFPLTVWGQQLLRVRAGSDGERPLIDATGQDVAIQINEGPPSTVPARLRGLDLVGGRVGVRSTESWFTMTDCTISGCAIGLDVASGTTGFDSPHLAATSISSCGTGIRYEGESGLWTERTLLIEGCDTGLDLRLPGPANFLWAFVLEGVVRGCGTGVRLRSSSAHMEIVRIRMEITRCDVGLDLESTGSTPTNLVVTSSTIADCAAGVLVRSAFDPLISGFSGCIFANNGSDAPLGLANMVINFSLVTSGSLAGQGVVTGDPMFVDSAGDDYSLLQASPAIDVLALGVAGADGRLDTSTAKDMGFYEFRTLRARQATIQEGVIEIVGVQPGEAVAFEVFGDPGSSVLLFSGSRSPSAPVRMTPFGSLSITNVDARRIGLYRIPMGSTHADISFTPDPAMAGTSRYYRALVSSAQSLSGFAFSSVVEVNVLP